MPEPEPATVTFEEGVLTVGNTRFTQFSDYQVSTFHKAPLWPATKQLVLEHSTDRPNRVLVSAAAVDPKRGPAWDVGRYLAEPEETMYGTREVPAIVEETLTRGRDACRYRVKSGPIEGESAASTNTGVIVTATDGEPTYAVFVDGFHVEDVQRVTVEMAKALCSGGAT